MNSTATSINILSKSFPVRKNIARGRRSSSVDAANDDFAAENVVFFPPRNGRRRRWLPISFRNRRLHVGGVTRTKTRRNYTKDGKLRRAWIRALDAVSEMTQESHRLKLAQELVPDLPFQTAFFTGKPGGNQQNTYGGRWPVYYAIEKEQIGLNSEVWVNWIVVDVDHDDIDMWKSCRLAKPKYLAINPKSGRYHIAWKLSRPVYRGPGAKDRHVAYLKRVWDAVTYEIGGDLFYSRFTTKNPFHADHDLLFLGGDDVDLGTLYAPVCLAPEIRRWGKEVQATGSRHLDLFNAIRFPAYRLHGHGYDYVYERVMALAHENNTFSECLPQFDIKAIVRSVTRFVVYRYQPGSGVADGKKRGVMNLAGKSLTLAERQSLGGKYGPKKRKGKTLEALEETLVAMLDQGIEVSQPMLVKASRFSRATVVRHWPAMVQIINDHEEVESRKMAENPQYAVEKWRAQMVRHKGGTKGEAFLGLTLGSLQKDRDGAVGDVSAIARSDRDKDQSPQATPHRSKNGLTDSISSSSRPVPPLHLMKESGRKPRGFGYEKKNLDTSRDYDNRSRCKLEPHPITGEIPDPVVGYVETVPF